MLDDILNGDETTALIAIGERLNGRYDYDTGNAEGPHRVFMLIEDLQREVNNGGFDQFFFNSSGLYANETVAALDAIGSITTKRIVERAIACFPDGQVPTDEDSLHACIAEPLYKQMSAEWSKLDNEYYNVRDENLDSLTVEFVRKHREEFDL